MPSFTVAYHSEKDLEKVLPIVAHAVHAELLTEEKLREFARLIERAYFNPMEFPEFIGGLEHDPMVHILIIVGDQPPGKVIVDMAKHVIALEHPDEAIIHAAEAQLAA